MIFCTARIVACALALASASFASGQADDSALQRLSAQGEQALAQGHYAEAEQAYEKLRDLSPLTAEVHARLGLIYFQERKFDQAVPTLRQALKLKPSLPKLDTLLAMSLSELGQYKEALPGLEKGFRSTDPAVKRMCGLQLQRAYTGLQRDNKAVEVALELNRVYGDDPEVLYQTGKIYGNYAYLTMQKLWHVGPDSLWRHLAAAEAYESQGSFDLAITEYRAVLAKDPNRPGVHYRLGRTLLSRQHEHHDTAGTAEAQHEFEQELEKDPSNANAAYELAETHRQAGQLDQAQALFESALKAYPDFVEAHLGLAAVHTAQDKAAQALPHLQRAVALDPTNEVAWYRLSLAQRKLGNAAEQERAMAEFKRLREKSSQQNLTRDLFSPQEVTKQELDSAAQP